MRAAGRRGFGAWAHAQWLRRAAPPEGAAAILCVHPPTLSVMALVSADSRIAELLGELHQLIKQTQVSGWGHTLTRKNLGGGGSDSTTPHPHPPLCSSSLPQEERSRSEHNLVNIQKTHERMQTENKSEGKRGEGDTQGYIASPDPHWGLGAPPRAPTPDPRVSPQSLPITGPSCGGSTPRPRLMRRPSASKLPPRTQIFNLKSPLFP